jgi:two-component system chemotaxis response regulator CheB
MTMPPNVLEDKYEAVVIGVSAGGLAAMDKILPQLNSDFCLPILIVQHINPNSENYLPTHYNVRCSLEVKEAEDKEPINPGTIYFSPPNYHLMVECDKSIALSVDPKVNFSRPSVDVLFETAASTYKEKLLGIILTGANKDGAAGVVKIKKKGGTTIVQAPETAEADAMPKAAIDAVDVDQVLSLEDITEFLNGLCGERK